MVVRKFGLEKRLEFFDFLRPTSATDPNQVRHRSGIGLPALLALEKLLPFLELLVRFSPLTTPYNRRVEGLGGPVKSLPPRPAVPTIFNRVHRRHGLHFIPGRRPPERRPPERNRST